MDKELPMELRNSVQNYLDALKANLVSLNNLLNALPAGFSDAMAIVHVSEFMDQLIKRGEEQLASYSDEIILGVPFLDRMDEVVGEINIAQTELGPFLDHVHTRFGTAEIRGLVSEVTRAGAAVTRGGVDWQFKRTRIKEAATKR